MIYTQPTIIATGERVILRDRLPSDLDSVLRWQTHGEWLAYDAPWENADAPSTEEAVEGLKQRFLAGCSEPPPYPRKRATIATRGENRPLGWVSRYLNERFPAAWFVGLDICEDDYLNRGLGTEALRLWVDYLFTHSDVHRLGLDTWSFNPRMMRVADKVGFRPEGAQREMIRWQGAWLDMVHYGLLRCEWEAGAT